MLIIRLNTVAILIMSVSVSMSSQSATITCNCFRRYTYVTNELASIEERVLENSLVLLLRYRRRHLWPLYNRKSQVINFEGSAVEFSQ